MSETKTPQNIMKRALVDVSSFSLCAPNCNVSCAACCGLYNFVDHGRANITSILKNRTDGLRKITGDLTKNEEERALKLAQKIPEIRKWVEEKIQEESGGYLFKTIKVCPLTGFLSKSSGGEEVLVGCMIHPAACGGSDIRDVGVYESDICHYHKCPSYNWLSAREFALLSASSTDWYVYGLCVTDAEYVKEVIKTAEEFLSRPLKEKDMLIPEAALGLAEIWRLKESWPFKDTSVLSFGAFTFENLDADDYSSRTIDYAALNAAPSRFDRIFKCLSSGFEDVQRLRLAEEKLEKMFAALAESIESARQQ